LKLDRSLVLPLFLQLTKQFDLLLTCRRHHLVLIAVDAQTEEDGTGKEQHHYRSSFTHGILPVGSLHKTYAMALLKTDYRKMH